MTLEEAGKAYEEAIKVAAKNSKADAIRVADARHAYEEIKFRGAR